MILTSAKMSVSRPSHHTAPLLDDASRMRGLVAYALQRAGRPDYNPFAAEVVHCASGRRVARNLNCNHRLCDPTAHAEILAIRRCCAKLQTLGLGGHTLYTTCEPCPMCMSAALWAGVSRVVYGIPIAEVARYYGQIYIPAAAIVERSDFACEVVGGVEEDHCRQLFHRMEALPRPLGGADWEPRHWT